MLSKKELERYSRHIRMTNVGIEGQVRLKKSKVLMIGAGGLGCPALQYLAAAGVGKIGIVDHDVVELSNLQRQVLFNQNDLGEYKAKVAEEKLRKLNDKIDFEAYTERLTNGNALSIIKDYDIVVDGSDNFPTRYLVNDSCVILNKPVVFGAIYKFEGQLSVFNYKTGPTYRCLYPIPPKHGEVENCADIGVLGVLPGVIGTRMANECLKLILEIGTSLSGNLLTIDLLENRELSMKITTNFENKKIDRLLDDYDHFCGVRKNETMEILPKDLDRRMRNDESLQIIDVREVFEYEICHLNPSKLIPLGQIPERFSEIEKGIDTVVICHHGMRSKAAIDFLVNKGFDRLLNLTGGIHQWSVDVDTDMPKY